MVVVGAATMTTWRRRGWWRIGHVVLSDPCGPDFTPGHITWSVSHLVDVGSVEIVVKNQGAYTQELVIVKGDDPALLPVDEYGGVIEDDLPEDDLIGEIPLVFPGTEESASFGLDAGSYILFCSILAPSEPPQSHFVGGDGMVNTTRWTTSPAVMVGLVVPSWTCRARVRSSGADRRHGRPGFGLRDKTCEATGVP